MQTNETKYQHPKKDEVYQVSQLDGSDSYPYLYRFKTDAVRQATMLNETTTSKWYVKTIKQN